MCEQQVSAEHRNLNTFILEMGDPISIVDVAQRMLEFYWKDPEKSIGVEFSGLRPGEKLDETLTWGKEHVTATCHPLIKRVCGSLDGAWFQEELATFEGHLPALIQLAATNPDEASMVQALSECVPGFHPTFNYAKVRKPTIVVHTARPTQQAAASN
jgi:FlaA1/EpsC-like NDP-sugar epimerase